VFCFYVEGKWYRSPDYLDEKVFDAYMEKLNWKLPFNMKVFHTQTGSLEVLQSFPTLAANMETFLMERIGVRIQKTNQEPLKVIHMWSCFMVVETDCGYGRLIKYNPDNDQILHEELYPIPFKQAKEFVNLYHRHNLAPQGHKFSIGLLNYGELIGVIIASVPKARQLNDNFTLEINRCCVLPDKDNACSKLYAKAIKAGQNMGYKRFITYTLPEESGSSLKAVGFKLDGITQSKSKGWASPSRPRTMPERYPVGQKCRWILYK